MWKASPIEILFDNIAWVLTSKQDAVVVDPGEARPIIKYLQDNNLICSGIIITHLHPDHIDGLEDLLNHYKGTNIPVYGPLRPPLTGIPTFVNYEQNAIIFANEKVTIHNTPGHCPDHICYVFPESKILLSGDLLFSMGCGRIISGTMEELWKSLNWVSTLPDDMVVCCGHEYTLKNAEFAEFFFPTDSNIKKRLTQVQGLRSNNILTVPTLLKDELSTNPFLRCNDKLLLANWGTSGKMPSLAFNRFVELRTSRNSF